MDDFILVHDDKNVLLNCLNFLTAYIPSIGLELNKKTTLQPIKFGISFLNWKFILQKSGKILVLQNKHKITIKSRKLKKLNRKVLCQEITQDRLNQIVKSMIAHLEKGNTVKTIDRFIDYIK